MHLDLAIRRRERRARHAAIRQQQASRPCLGAKVHTPVGRRAQQARDQREPVAQLHRAPVQREVGEVPRHALRDVGQRARRARHVHERAQVGTGLDRESQERRLAQGLAQARGERAELARIVRRGDHGAAARPRAAQRAVRVGNRRPAFERDGGVLLEERDHARRGGEEGVHARFVEVRA